MGLLPVKWQQEAMPKTGHTLGLPAVHLLRLKDPAKECVGIEEELHAS
jgi:hypothetical protein